MNFEFQFTPFFQFLKGQDSGKKIGANLLLLGYQLAWQILELF
jgi:hypothetical protein